MRLDLSPADQRQLVELTTTLLSPFDYDVDHWRSAVNAQARQLLRADCASFMLPADQGVHLYSDEWPSDIPNSYPQRVAALDREHGFWRRQLHAGAWARAEIYTPAMYRSEYYEGFVVPARAFDAIGITVQCNRRSALAGLLFHHTSRTGRQFGERATQVLRLLVPTFSAAVRMQQLQRRAKSELTNSIDKVLAPMFLVAGSGVIEHANPTARLLLQSVHGDDWVQQVARLAVLIGSEAKAVQGALPGTRCVSINGTSHTLDISHARFDCGGPRRHYIVAVRNLGDISKEEHAIGRDRLTPQEERVLTLLKQRHTNREIAALLGVSEHTARHHTENLFLKLGIRSRREIN